MATEITKPPPLVVTADSLAVRLGMSTPLDETTKAVLEAAIRDAQDDVEAYLGRVITPAQFTETECVAWRQGWDLEQFPVLEVVSVVEEKNPDGEPTGRYTVTYKAGMDARHDRELRPILRYVSAHAMNQPGVVRLWRETEPDAGRRVTSVSTEGQSVSYAYDRPAGGNQVPSPGSGAPGALPTLKSLDRWRIAGRRVFQRRTPAQAPWPYSRDEWRWW